MKVHSHSSPKEARGSSLNLRARSHVRRVRILPLLLSFSLILASCAQLPIPGFSATPTLPSVPTATLVSEATSSPTVVGEATPSPPGPATLRIWVPPQFDPASGTPAGNLLQARLKQFTERRSGTRIEARVKAASGPGGLLDSLTTASAAAPLALPDLVLLPRAELETAALKGLLYPLTDLTAVLEQEDWYPYAQQAARVQNSIFGLPFAGEALILLYRPAEVEAPPPDWESTLSLGQPLAFPAADEQALFTLAQYMATGAEIQDGEGRPTLDTGALTRLLAFYQNAETAEVMPFWLTQFSTDEQAWEAYQENRANLVITWTGRYLRQPPGDTAAAPILTQNGDPFTLANVWVWALSTHQDERHPLSIELAEFLSDGDFLARWSSAAGYLPPRASALAGWSNPTLQSLADRVVRSARMTPSTDVLSVLSPALQTATLEVLKEQADPDTAAQEAAGMLESP